MIKQLLWLGAVVIVSMQAVCGADTEKSRLIVDWGHDWGTGWYRETPDIQANPPKKLADVDVNGNGTKEDDWTGGWAYDWDAPLSPTNAVYDFTLPNARFFGGVVVRVTDIPKGEDGKTLKARAPTEGHINQNHEMRDDWNMMAMPSKKREPGLERFAGALLVMWKKEDFLNGGDSHPVAFGPDSVIGVFISRYWGGIDWGRWVVRDSGKFYVSKDTFAGQAKQFDLESGGPENGAENPVVRHTHAVIPDQTQWAEYTPVAPDEIFFDADKAQFAAHKFENVEAVGFLAQRNLSKGHPVADGLWKLPHGIGEPIALKFNAVQVRAVIRDKAPSANVDLVGVGGEASAPALWVSKTEIPYRIWSKIWRWAVTNQRARAYPDNLSSLVIPGYSFARDGSAGSMQAASDDAAYSTAEPVTDITWYDTLVWCNALSELEGLTPAYYEDASFTKPLRQVFNRTQLAARDARMPVYWKKDSEGYRLPTQEEWSRLAGAEATPQEAGAWIESNSKGKTHPVGALAPNALGLCDVLGNVSEYVWDVAGTAFDPAQNKSHTVMGGSFCYPVDENAHSLMPFGQKPYEGTYSVGLRVVRNGQGTGKLPEPGKPPTRTISESLEVSPAKEMSEAQLKESVLKILHPMPAKGQLPETDDMFKIYKDGATYPAQLAIVETPYRVWNQVQNWAVRRKGYRFNHSGDMGSLQYIPGKDVEHTQKEPVTNVTWVDAAVWCNALSELCGLPPAYVDKKTAEPVREASPFRLATYEPYRYPNTGRYAGREVDTGAVLEWKVLSAQGGFRLPTQEELNLVHKPGKSEDEGWFSTNSKGQTQPVGVRTADASGFCDLDGNVLEWTYGGSALFGEIRYGNSFMYAAGCYPHRAHTQESPFVGRWYLGFRVLRAEKNP